MDICLRRANSPKSGPGTENTGENRKISHIMGTNSLAPIDEGSVSCYNAFTEMRREAPTMSEQPKKPHMSAGLLALVCANR